MAEKQYIQILEESLDKKIEILSQLQVLCEEQAEILQDSTSTPEAFEENVDKKEILINRLETLDKGFDAVFAKIEEELSNNRQQYKEQILRMQEQIRRITDASVALQASEKHNQDLARKKFAEVKSQARELRKSGQAVSSYYQNMMKVNSVDPQFMDSKK